MSEAEYDALLDADDLHGIDNDLITSTSTNTSAVAMLWEIVSFSKRLK
jgi:hypothetical protein